MRFCKSLLSSVLSFALLLLTVSCDTPERECDFTDSLGNGVTLPDEPGRVAVLFSSLALLIRQLVSDLVIGIKQLMNFVITELRELFVYVNSLVFAKCL